MKKKQIIKSATIRDFSNYHSARCNNGGQYGFWETYTFKGEDQYEVEFHTTADFSFCRYCGTFSCCCDQEPEFINQDELWKRIKEAENDSSEGIDAEYVFCVEQEWIDQKRSEAINLIKNSDEALFSCLPLLDLEV